MQSNLGHLSAALMAHLEWRADTQASILMLFCALPCRYNDLVLAGRDVQGSGVGVLDSQDDSVTRRYREAVNNGFTTVRLFASGGEGDNKALESEPGAE